jgi:hypothetical protein
LVASVGVTLGLMSGLVFPPIALGVIGADRTPDTTT